MKLFVGFILFLLVITSIGCRSKVIREEKFSQVISSPIHTIESVLQKTPPMNWEFDEDTYENNEFSEPLAKFYIKAKRKLYAGYKITKEFEKKGGKASIYIHKGEENLLSIEQENVNSYWLRWGLFPFLGKKTSQLVIMKYSGGAHCCTSYQIYDLVPEFRLIFDGDEYEMDEIGNSLIPVDIDRDGIYEFMQSVMAFDYFHASHARSVFPTAVFAYNKTAETYLPANKRYGNYLLNRLDKDLRAAVKQATAYENTISVAFEDYYFAHMNVVLKYFYAGKQQAGWDYFEKNYKRDDKDELRKDLKVALSDCPIYKSLYESSVK